MWEENKHPRDNDGKFTCSNVNSNSNSKQNIHRARVRLKKLMQNKIALKENSVQNENNEKTLLDKLMGKEFTGVKGQAAVEKLMQEKQGHVKAAFHRDDVGDIDLLWGNENFGLWHIIKQREKQGIIAEQFIKDIADVVEKGEYFKKNNRGDLQFIHNGKMAIIALEYHGKKITYLLTAFNTRYKSKASPTSDDA